MAYLEHSDLRELFDVVEDIKEARLTLCLNAAARTLKSWVGADTYDEAADDTLETLKFAEANLAVYHLLLNNRIQAIYYHLLHRHHQWLRSDPVQLRICF